MTKINFVFLLSLSFLVLSCSSGPDLSDWDPTSENVTSLRILTENSKIDEDPSPLGDDEILFSSKRQGNMDIWSTGISGGGVRQLTNYGGPDRHPSPHPNGKEYTFISDRGGDIAYYLGSTEKPLATKLTDVSEPEDFGYSPGRISPDGSTMVYVSGRHIWTYDIETDRSTQLITGFFPSWYPDGDKIVFVRKNESDSGLNTSIWSMNKDGTGLTQIVSSNKESLIMQPDVSPDGERIAYVKATLEINDGLMGGGDEILNNVRGGSQYKNPDIFISNTDGSSTVRLTTNPFFDIEPRWISNQRIIFTSSRPKSKDEESNWNLWTLEV